MSGDSNGGTERTLYPVRGCGKCADIVAAHMLGGRDTFEIMERHLENHEFKPSLWADVEKLARAERRKAARGL